MLVLEATIAKLKRAINNAGSAIAAINISREEPMPPKELAASSPAKDKKKRPNASIKIMSMISPIKFAEICEEKTGSNTAAVTTELSKI